MSASDAPTPSRRSWWIPGAFALLAATMIGMKCLCGDPADAMRRQVMGPGEVRGAPMRAAASAVATSASATPASATPAAAPTSPPVAAAPAPTAAPRAAVAAAPATSESAAAVEIAPPKTSLPASAPNVAASSTSAAAAPPTAAGSAPPSAAAPQPTSPAPTPAAAAAKAEPAKAPAVASAGKSKYKSITWDDISKYTYVPPDPDEGDGAATTLPAKEKPKTDQIPADIRAMSGGRFTIEGYAVPLDYDKGVVMKFIILPAPLACCFAEAPPMNRWMTVSNDARVEFDYAKYNLMRVSGVFDVGEETREGYVVGIYRMKAEKIENVNE